ncbi:MAG TPA: septal ring lytic transglycosylase RlpA family protein [Bryobacteraceae bacterium]|jgi:rare lipoprotein A|nr:septal ring lytic transglycosylase RlpA family protein [Bryobacteraceae bacterium]
MKCAWALLVAAIVLSGCAHKKKHVKLITATPRPMGSVKAGYAETGIASWYGHPYHGRPAADGEIYDMETMVAAHRTLPFQTWVRVYDLDNNKTVDVRIIDRGPFVDGRIIDLSHAAAQAIDMVRPGIANVRMEVIQAPVVTGPAIYVVQVGAFESRAVAEQVQSGLAEHYGMTRVIQRRENPGIWRVLVGNESSLDAASALCARIQTETGEKKAFAVRLDSQ